MSRAPTNVLIFDGDCGFCTSAANFVVRRSSVPIEAVAWQLTDVSAFGLTEAETARRVYFVTKGHAFGGHHALAQVMWLQRGIGWKALGWLMTIPPTCWIASMGYALVARFRHRLPGGTPACAVSQSR
jgi:predicted DCC family thiol-disulfide oxidoreductase YuxK